MPDLVQTANVLKSLPDQALQLELANPSGAVPSYLVLAEAQRRAIMRSGAQQTQQQQPSSVYEDVMRGMMARQPAPGPPTPPGATPPPSNLGQLSQGSPPPPGNFKPPQAMAEGGSVDDPENEGGADYGGDDGEESHTPPAQGSADRSASDQYDNYIQSSAERNGVNPNLIRAVIKNESNFKRGAVSSKGATGLMQLMPGTARDMGVKDRTDPQQNIEGGTRYIKWLGDNYGSDLDTVLAGYNAGPGAVQKYGGVPPYKQTESYINRVKGTLYSLEKQPAADTAAATDTADAAPPAPEDLGGTPPAVASTPDLSTLAAPGVAALTASVPPAGPNAPAARPAATADADTNPYSDKNIETQRRLFERLYGPKAEPSAALKAEIARLQAQTQYAAKPHFWQSLADFGWGMAASPAHSLLTQIGAGGQAMTQAQAKRIEEARKSQLDLLGVDVKLDDQARDAQGKIAQLTGQAVNQAAQKQIADFEALTTPGMIRGNSNESPGSGYRFVPNPAGGQGKWMPPTTGTVTDEMLPLLKGMRNSSGSEFQAGDTISATQLGKISDKLADINAKKIEAANKPDAKEAGLEDYATMIAQREKLTIDPSKPVLPQLTPQLRVEARQMAAGKTPADAATIAYWADLVHQDAANIALVPAAARQAVGDNLRQRGLDVKRLDAATRALTTPQDPAEVSHWATQVQNDAKNWSLVQANKGLAEAVRKELTTRGVNVNQLDATTRQTAEFAHTVRPHIDKIGDLIDKMPTDKIGPLFGRWEEFKAGKWGAGDPAYTALRTNINLLDSAVARIHGGAKGGGSLPMIDYMHSMLSAGPKDAASMKAALGVFNEWVKGYEGMAPGIAGQTSGTPGKNGPPARVKIIKPDGSSGSIPADQVEKAISLGARVVE